MLLPQHIVCIQYVILFFSFCQQRLLLRTIKETKCTLPTRKNGTLCRFLLQLVHTQRKCKNRIQLLLYPAFLAESEGLGSLRSPASLLRKLSYCRLLLTRLRLAKDYKGSNPLLSYQQKNKGYSKRYTIYSWRRVRDSAHFVRPRVCSANYPIVNLF